MRRRLIVALVGVAVVTLALYATPRAFAVDALLRRQERHALERSADLMSRLIAQRLATGDLVDPTFVASLAGDGEQVIVELGDGSVVRSGPRPPGSTISVGRKLDTGGQLTLRITTDAVDERIADAVTSRLETAAIVTGIAVVIAVVLARRLAAPFSALASHTELIGTEAAGPAPRSNVPEAQRLADALDRSRRRLDDLLQREREFSANASHQLRTPLTALRLHLDDLALWPETSAAVREELRLAIAEADRLAATIDDLLELARSGAMGPPGAVDVNHAVQAAARRFAPRFREADRSLHVRQADGPAVTTTASGAIGQILDVLVENALVHGARDVTVTVSRVVAGTAIRVQDEGTIVEPPGRSVFDRSVRSDSSTGAGIGLALAAHIARSIGGRLVLAAKEPTTFELFIPHDAPAPFA